MLNTLTLVKQKYIVVHMKKKYTNLRPETVKISNKFQLVIPASARKVMDLRENQKFIVKAVTNDEIVFRKLPKPEEFYGAFDDVFPDNATAAIRKMRDEEW